MQHEVIVNRIVSNNGSDISAGAKIFQEGELHIFDFDDDELITKRAALEAIPEAVQPTLQTIAEGTQLTAVVNEDGENTWAYQINYSDPDYQVYGQAPTIIIRRGLTQLFVANKLDNFLDIYLPDFDDTGKTTQTYQLAIKI